MNTDQSAALLVILMANGYKNIRLLPTGEWAATSRMAFTWGLFLGLDKSGYRTRFCYGNELEAAAALQNWSGEGFPPGYWIKQKPEEIQGPGGEGEIRNKASA